MFDKIFKILLLFVIVCSKEFLVFNEEILILFAFSLFIYLISTRAGNLIAQDLDANISEIKNKFLTYKNLKEKSILYNITYVQRQNVLSLKIQNLLKLKNLYIHKLLVTYNINIKKYILNFVEDSLSRFALNERTKKMALHEAYQHFFFGLIAEFVRTMTKTLLQYESKKKLVNLKKIK
jgi:hypothetical protein